MISYRLASEVNARHRKLVCNLRVGPTAANRCASLREMWHGLSALSLPTTSTYSALKIYMRAAAHMKIINTELLRLPVFSALCPYCGPVPGHKKQAALTALRVGLKVG